LSDLSNTSVSKSRFSSRVENYVKYRPHYPDAVVDVLRSEIGFTPDQVVADIGSGTGISCEPFLKNGNTVFAIEPNADMRAAAEKWWGGNPKFHSMDASAEATSLPDRSADLVVAGQAFHWFDVEKAKDEFRRILKPGGHVLLMWNTRTRDDAFDREYEAYLLKYGADFQTVRHEQIAAETFSAFFKTGSYKQIRLPNPQTMDLEALKGRMLSSSYMPQEGAANFDEMMRSLRELFDRHQKQGKVVMTYDTELHIGQV
jgi:SAM-dependent methyltransferase